MDDEKESISDTRFKLHEAAYFLNQMKKNVDDKTDFIFNLIASVGISFPYSFFCC
jgi:hypothetical protein